MGKYFLSTGLDAKSSWKFLSCEVRSCSGEYSGSLEIVEYMHVLSSFDLRRRGNRLIRLQTSSFLMCPFKHDRLERQMRELREEMAATSRQEEEHKKRRMETVSSCYFKLK